ncbi:unnamed protein product [Mycena citricolor]|uniref:Oxidoreductase n=1 Tax=Mycena citricolor TaxID=2018698 RepID=A0AAD2HHX0_9AGAR|nr:unnamed protein product [Mycena citricolor]CAK5276664.1 unnamed protein product [Mycena citricolor]
MPTVLIVGATRGLGDALASAYSDAGHTVYATSRSDTPPTTGASDVTWIPSIDIASESAGEALAAAIPVHDVIDILVVTAGYFVSETFDEPKWSEEVKMYTTCAIGPLFVVQGLVAAGKIRTAIGSADKGGKVVLVSSESGSIALRHEKEGGGNYAHHASKSALNMVGKLLSLDLKDRGISVALVHPGFMRTELTRNVGYDQYWESGGAVSPQEAASSLISFIDTFTIEQTGEYWAPRGARDIGTAPDVLGPDVAANEPLQLPW